MVNIMRTALLGIVGLGITFVALSTSGCGSGDADGKAQPSARKDDRERSGESTREGFRLVPPLSFTGATFSDGDDTRDVETVKLHTWTDKTKLPATPAEKADPSKWTGNTETPLAKIAGKPTWTAGDLKLAGVVALAFVVDTALTSDPTKKATTINYTLAVNPDTHSAGLAESGIAASNMITNRVLVGLNDPTGPLGIDVVVDANKEK